MKDIIFYIDEKKLNDNLNQLASIGTIWYPLKTNSNLKLLSLLKNKTNFAISTIKHLHKIKQLKIPCNCVCVINTLNQKLYKKAYYYGIRNFTFDDLDQLKMFSQYANLKECNIVVRLNLGLVSKENYHLGCNKKESIQIINFLHKNNTKEISFSFYTKDIKLCDKMIKYIKKNYNNESISISGLRNYSKDIQTKLKEFKDINIEPGFILVNNVVSAKIKIIREKENNIILKNGIYNGFFDIFFHKKYKLYLGNYKLYYKKHKNTNPIYLYGGSGDSIDKLGKFYIKNYNHNNKYITIYNIGAYFEELFFLKGIIRKTKIKKEK